MKECKFKVGDVVRFTAAHLKNMGVHSGEIAFWQSKVVKVTKLGDKFIIKTQDGMGSFDSNLCLINKPDYSGM